MLQFYSKLHPLLVHLPIGIFSFGLILKFYSLFFKKNVESNIYSLVLFSTIFFSVLSLSSGYILSETGEFSPDIIVKHRNFAIIFTLSCVILYFFQHTKFSLIFWLFSAVLLGFTGHYGGNLSYGDSYFSNKDLIKKEIDLENGTVYSDLVEPIFEKKCFSCHSSKKQKGELRLDNPDSILKGGKHGSIINSNDLSESLLLERLFMPENEEDHMPPKGKPQLNENEKELISWWINNGADFSKKISYYKKSDTLKNYLASNNSDLKIETQNELIPEGKIEKANEKYIASLNESGFVVKPIAENSNYLKIHLSKDSIKNKGLKDLNALKNQVIWFDAMGLKHRESYPEIGKLENLTRLNLMNSTITDEELKSFKNLKKLRYLNLTGTNISFTGINHLKDLEELRKLYLVNTEIDSLNQNELIQIFPKAEIYFSVSTISESDSLKFEN